MNKINKGNIPKTIPPLRNGENHTVPTLPPSFFVPSRPHAKFISTDYSTPPRFAPQVRTFDKMGNGWDMGSLSLYQDINNQSEKNLMPVVRSFTRQDPHKGATQLGSEGEARSPNQWVGARICDRAYAREHDRSMTHRACRQKCRDAGALCTHYTWTAKTPETVVDANPFRGIESFAEGGAAVYADGHCIIFDVPGPDVGVPTNARRCDLEQGDGTGRYMWGSGDDESDASLPRGGQAPSPSYMDEAGTPSGGNGHTEPCNEIHETEIMTHADAKARCNALGKNLCSEEQLCARRVDDSVNGLDDRKWPVGGRRYVNEKDQGNYRNRALSLVAVSDGNGNDEWAVLGQGPYEQDVWGDATGMTYGSDQGGTTSNDAEERFTNSKMICRGTVKQGTVVQDYGTQPFNMNVDSDQSDRFVKEEILCCGTNSSAHHLRSLRRGFANNPAESDYVQDCPTERYRKDLTTREVPDQEGAQTVIFKHKYADDARFTVQDRSIATFGEEFEIEVKVTDCPPGYYCPNTQPQKCHDPGMCAWMTLNNYYDPAAGNTGRYQIKCANFPFRGGSDSASTDSWYLEALHGQEYGSLYTYYCPGGTPFPLRVPAGNKCASGFVNGDRYMASNYSACPQLKFADVDNIGTPAVNLADINSPTVDFGEVQRPGQAEIRLEIQNSGEGGMNYGLTGRQSNVRWLSVDGGKYGIAFQAGAQDTTVATAAAMNTEITLTVETGNIVGVAGDEVSTWVEFYWELKGRQGVSNLTVSVTPVENNALLTFPFTINEEVVAGEQKSVSMYVFNINPQTDVMPYILNGTYNSGADTALLPDFIRLDNDQHPDLPCIAATQPTTDGEMQSCFDASTLTAADHDLKNLSTPYLLPSKQFQRVTVILDGRRESSWEPLTGSIVIRAYDPSVSSGTQPGDIARVPVAITVTPGPAIPEQTHITWRMDSDPYADSQVCYVDCEAMDLPNYATQKYLYGFQWAKNNYEELIYRNCHTGETTYAEQPNQCGDCNANVKARMCSGIPEQSLTALTTVRSSKMHFTLEPRDAYDTMTALGAGKSFIISLTDMTSDENGTVLGTNVIADTVATDTGTGLYTATVSTNVNATFELAIMVASPDPADPTNILYAPVAGSPFNLTSTNPVCPPNSAASQCDENTAEGQCIVQCECNAGYSPSKTAEGQCNACAVGKAKSNSGSGRCTACTVGKVAQTVASTACTFCPGK